MPVLSTSLTRVASKRLISKHTLDQAYDIEATYDHAIDAMVIEVGRFVVSDHAKNIYWSVEYPASWWQYFKRDVLRPLTDNPSTPIGWWLAEKARAIEYKREEFRESYVTKMCPHVEVPPESPAHFMWLIDGGPVVR